jgi:hypothetical protein
MVVFSLVIFEGLLRLFSYVPERQMYDYTILFDRDILFRIKPLCAPDINDLGYRGTHFDRGRIRLKKRVLFFGDSFVLGRNVAPGETIAASLGKSLGSGYEVLNMGVLAYGPDQSLLALMDHGLDLKPDMVILGVFAANDFQDIQRNKLYSLDGGGRLIQNVENTVTENLPRSRTMFLFDRLQYNLRKTIDPHHKYLSRRYEYLLHDLFSDYYDFDLLMDPDSNLSMAKIDVMKAILEKFHDELHLRGIKFAVVIIPSYPNIVDENEFLKIGLEDQNFQELKAREYGFFGLEDILVDLCTSLDIPFLNLYPEFMSFEKEERARLYDGVDWHLSVFGNRVAGDLAASVLVRPLVPKPVWKMEWEWRSTVSHRPWL